MTDLETLARETEAMARRLAETVTRLMARASDHAVPPETLVRVYPRLAHYPEFREAFGEYVTRLVARDFETKDRSAILERLVDPATAERAKHDAPRILVLNTRMLGTWVCEFAGTRLLEKTFLHRDSDAEDTAAARAQAVAKWIERRPWKEDEIDVVACRGGFVAPVPCGTYWVSESMAGDVARAKISHHSNLAIGILVDLRSRGVIPDTIPAVVTDPVACDELETVERLTGFPSIWRTGAAVHYLNHRGCHRLVASHLGLPPQELVAVSVHLGAGSSAVAHVGGRIPRTVDTFSATPSANRSGDLDIGPVLLGLKQNRFNLKQIEEAVFERGGLLALAGTDDFSALLAFRRQGATQEQAAKIDWILDLLARRTAGLVGSLAQGLPDSHPLVLLTGPLLRSREIRQRVLAHLGKGCPAVIVPGSVENEALAAGALAALYTPETVLDYETERNRAEANRRRLEQSWNTVIFERPLRYRVRGAPIRTIDELVDAAYLEVREHFPPRIAIVGAANEAAVLAAKKANERGRLTLARFVLVDDYEAVSALAYDYDLVVDGHNYRILDTDDPVQSAVELLDRGDVDILMKGRLKTEVILRGVLSYLRRSGRLRKGQIASHVVTVEIPTRSKLVLITDAAVNPYPDEERKLAILDNALKVARSLHIPMPKVAVLSAIESVNPSVDSSLEARRIAERMADRTDCIVEGPLSFDVAMSPEAAAEKGYRGCIQGDADILLMPDIDAGNVVYKALTTQSGATVAGVILVGHMPMVLTSRGDSARSKLASIAQAVKLWAESEGDDANSSGTANQRG